MYSIASLPAALPEWAQDVLSVNPAAVYISLASIGWAAVALAVGVVYFWQAETRYGRG